MRGGMRSAGPVAAGIAFFTVSCAPAPPPSATPPVIEFVGVPAEVRLGDAAVTYVLEDGGSLMVDVAGYREVGPHGWSGELIVLGSDADGPFVSSFTRQAGLPDDCYVENEVGVDRGAHIEIRGILWAKGSGFTPAAPVSAGERR